MRNVKFKLNQEAHLQEQYVYMKQVFMFIKTAINVLKMINIWKCALIRGHNQHNKLEIYVQKWGNFMSFDSRTQIPKTGFIKSRHLNDKSSVTMIIGLLKKLKHNDATTYNTILHF